MVSSLPAQVHIQGTNMMIKDDHRKTIREHEIPLNMSRSNKKVCEDKETSTLC